MRIVNTSHELQKAVLDNALADIGFAFDGDGDRVIAINHYGTIKNGDDYSWRF